MFVDIGAHIGIFTMLASRIVGPSGMVYAYEPNKANYSVLVGHSGINRLRNVKPYGVAVGNEQKSALMSCAEGESPLGSIHDRAASYSGSETDTIEVQIIDASPTLQEIPTDAAGILKVDTEGYEYEVCLGLSSFIKSHPKFSFLAEITSDWINHKSGVEVKALFDIFEGAGFKLFIVGEEGTCSVLVENATEWQFDLFATKKIVRT